MAVIPLLSRRERSSQRVLSPSLQRLNALAEELRKADPKLTKEQAFTKAYADPANRDLVQAERAEARAAA